MIMAISPEQLSPDEIWKDALGGMFESTVAGTPGTWRQFLPAAVTVDPSIRRAERLRLGIQSSMSRRDTEASRRTWETIVGATGGKIGFYGVTSVTQPAGSDQATVTWGDVDRESATSPSPIHRRRPEVHGTTLHLQNQQPIVRTGHQEITLTIGIAAIPPASEPVIAEQLEKPKMPSGCNWAGARSVREKTGKTSITRLCRYSEVDESDAGDRSSQRLIATTGKSGMSNLDKRLCAIFKIFTKSSLDPAKEKKAEQEMRTLLEKLRDPEYSKKLWSAFTEVKVAGSKRGELPTNEFWGLVETLRNAELVRTSALLFTFCLDAGGALGQEEMLRLAPDAASVEIWRKKKKIPPEELQKTLLADIKRAYETAAGDWLLKHCDAKRVSPLLNLLLKLSPRPRHLPTPFEAFSKALTGDASGLVAAEALRGATTPEEIRLLVQILLQKPVFRVAVEALSKAAVQRDAPVGLVALIKELCGAALVANDSSRELITAGLARIGTGILIAEKRVSEGQGVVAEIVQLGRHLEIASTKEQRGITWTLQNPGAELESPKGRQHITEDGARRVAVAFEKAAEGFGAVEVLTMLARNLGMLQTGKKGDAVRYDPLEHEDTQGGMEPGDPAVLEEPGWSMGERVVVRAKVKP